MLWTRWRFARTLFAAALLLIPAPLLPLRAAARMVPRTRPIHLDPRNPHYFRFRGRTVALTASGEHYGAVLNADFDFREYLATLSAEGLNYTRIFGGSYVEVPAKSFGILRNDLAPQPGRLIAPWARSEVPGYAGGGNKFDLSRWNGEYFGRYRDFLAEASRLGIVVEITLFSSQYGDAQWNLSPFNPSNNVNHTGAIDWKKLATLENGNLFPFRSNTPESWFGKRTALITSFSKFRMNPGPTARRSLAWSILICRSRRAIHFRIPLTWPMKCHSPGNPEWRNGSRKRRPRCPTGICSHRTARISVFLSANSSLA